MDKVELEFEFAINSPEAKAEAEQVKKSITGVGDTAEQQAKRVESAVKRISVLDDSTIAHLKKISDAKKSQYDAAAATIGGKASTVEVPDVNNIKNVAEEVLNLKKASKENNEEQEKGSSVIGDLIGGAVSWGGAITLVAGLLWAYREQIVDWVKEMWTGVAVNKDLLAAQEAVNTAMQNANTLIAEEVAQTTISIDKITNKNISLERRGELLDQFILNNPAVLGALNLQNLATAEGTAILDNYLLSLRKKIELQQLEKSYTESIQKEADIKSGKEDTKAGWFPKAMIYTSDFLFEGFGDTEKKIKALDRRYQANAEMTQEIISKTLEDKIKAAIDGDAKLKSVEDNSIKSREDRVTTINERLRNLQKGESSKTLMAEKELLEKEIKQRKIAVGLENADKPKKAAKAAVDTTIKEREGLYKQLIAIDAEYTRKSFSKDAEEVQALKDKFAKIRTLIENFNKKNPKKAISLVDLNETEKTAESDLIFRQQTAKQKISIDEQKKLYAEYESYKTTFGEAKAKERFNTEVKTNKQLIKELTSDNEKLVLKAKTSSLSAPEQERLNQNKKDVAELQNLEDKRYAAAYESALTTAQKIERINEEYRGKARELGAAITNEQKDNLLKLRDDAVNAAKDEALQKTEIYKTLSEETIELTRKQVKEQIAILKTLMANGSIAGDAKTELQNQLGKLEFFLKVGVNQSNLDALKNRLANLTTELNATDGLGNSIVSPKETKRILKDLSDIQAKINIITSSGTGKAKSGFAKGLAENFSYLKGNAEDVAKGISNDLGQVSGALGNLSNSLGGLDTKAGYALGTVSELASVGSDAAGAFASFASGDIVGGVTKAISAVAGLFSIGKRVKEMNAAARQEVADFYANAISGERVYQDLLAQRALQNVRDNKAVLKGIRDEVALRKTQLSSYAKETAEIMAKLQGQSSIASETYKHGTWFRKAEVKKTYSSLAGKSFQELSQLLAQGKLEGDAKALVERLKEIEEKGYDAEQAMADLARETSELFTGTTADDLTNSLLEMFKSGKTEAQDLADFFKAAMDDAALSIFKNKVLSDMIMKFYDEFDKAAQSDESLTDTEIAGLQNLFTSLTDDAKKKFEELKKITGSDLGSDPNDDDKSPNNVVGGIKAMSQQTAEIIAGQFGGQRIATLEGNEIARMNGATSMEQLAQMKSTALIIIKIEDNTRRSAEAEESALPILKSIESKLSSNNNQFRATGN